MSFLKSIAANSSASTPREATIYRVHFLSIRFIYLMHTHFDSFVILFT